MLIRYDTEKSKTVRKLKEILDEDSTNIFYPSIIDDHYSHRPEELESMSLYEFVQWYITKIKPRGKSIKYFQMDNSYYVKRKRGYLIIDMMSIHDRKNISFYYFSCFNHGGKYRVTQ